MAGRAEAERELDAFGAKFSSLASSSNAASAAMASGFASSSAQVSQSLGSASAGAEAAMRAVAGSSNQALSGLQSLASGAVASGSTLSALETTAANLSRQVVANQQAISAYSGEILETRRSMTDLARNITDASTEFGSNSQRVKELQGQYKQLSSVSRGLSVDKAQLVLETRNLGTQLTATQSAASTLSKGIQASGQAANQATGFFARLAQGLTASTNQLTSQGTVWAGFDRPVTSVIRAIAGPAGFTVALSLALTVAGSLITKVIDLVTAKKKLAEVDKEAAAIAAVLAGRQAEFSASSGANVSAINSQSSATLNNIHTMGNLTAALTTISEKQREVDKQTQLLDRSMTILTTTGQVNRMVVTQGGQAYTEMVQSAESLRTGIAETSAEINKQTKEMGPAIESVRLLASVTGASVEQVLEFALQNRILAERDLPAVRSAMMANLPVIRSFISHMAEASNTAFDFQTELSSLQAQIAKFKFGPLKFDISPMEGSVEAGIQRAVNANNVLLRQQPELIGNAKRLAASNQEWANVMRLIGSEAAATGRNVKDLLRAQTPFVQENIKNYVEYNKGVRENNNLLEGNEQRHRATGGAARVSSAAHKELLSVTSLLRQEMERFNESLSRHVIQTQVDAILVEKLKNAYAGLLALLRQERNPAQNILDTTPLITGSLATLQQAEGATHQFAIEQWLLHEQAADAAGTAIAAAAEEAAKQAHDSLVREFQDLSRQLPESWNIIIDGIISGSGRAGDALTKLGVEVKGWAADILGVVDSIPGHFGDAARDILRTADQYIKFADRVLAVLHRLDSDIPASLGAIIESITKQTTAVQQAGQATNNTVTGMGDVMIDFGQIVNGNMVIVDNWGGAVQDSTKKAADSTTQASSQMVQAIGRIGAALAAVGGLYAAHKQGGFGGLIGGAASGAALGAQIGSIVPGIGTAIGAGVGAIAGGLFGLFGGGKSAEQKRAEALQRQQAEDQAKVSSQNVLQAVESTKQSLLKTASDATELIKSIALHIDVPDSVFDSWFEDLDRLMKGFAERMQKWADQFEKEEGKTAERMQLVAQAAVSIAAAIDAVRQTSGVTQSKIDLLGDAWERIVVRLDAVEEMITKKQRRHAAKLAESTGALPEFVTGLAESITAINDMTVPDASKFDQMEKAATEILVRSDRLFEQIDRWRLKVTGQSAESGLPVLEFWKSQADMLNSAADLKFPSPAVWQQIGEAAKAAIDVAFDVLEGYAQENLSRAAELSETASPIASFMTALFGTFKAGNETGSISVVDFAQVRSQAKALIQVAVDLASDITSDMAKAGQRISQEASQVPSFISAIFGAIKAGSEAKGLAADFSSIRLQGKLMFDAVMDLSRGYSPEVLAEMQRVAEAGNGIAGFAQNLSQAVSSTKEASVVSSTQIGDAVKNFGLLVQHVATLRLAITPQIFDAAEEVSRKALGIGTNLQAFGNSMAAVSQMKVTSADNLLLSSAAYLTNLSAMLQYMTTADSVAGQIEDRAMSIEDHLLAAAQAMARGVNEVAGSLPGGGGLPVPVISPGGGNAGGKGDTHIHLTVNGSLLTDAHLEDKLKGTWENLQQRGYDN